MKHNYESLSTYQQTPYGNDYDQNVLQYMEIELRNEPKNKKPQWTISILLIVFTSIVLLCFWFAQHWAQGIFNYTFSLVEQFFLLCVNPGLQIKRCFFRKTFFAHIMSKKAKGLQKFSLLSVRVLGVERLLKNKVPLEKKFHWNRSLKENVERISWLSRAAGKSFFRKSFRGFFG